MQPKTDLRRDDIARHVTYDPDTGAFIWTKPTHARIAVGAIAGGKKSDGYVRILLNGRSVSAHRAAWLLMTGEWPAAQIDHINGNRSDNRWANLREADVDQNLANRPVMPSSRSLLKGVYWSPRHRRFGARIRTNGTRKFLGYFATADEASSAYEAEARERYGEFFRPSTGTLTGTLTHALNDTRMG